MNLFRSKSKRKESITDADNHSETDNDKFTTAKSKREENKINNEEVVSNSNYGEGNESIQEGNAEAASKYSDNNEELSEHVESVSLEINIMPSATEKNSLLPVLFELRQDAAFCDVAFLCHGKLFTAHRCIVK